jgi:HK97 family phage major capsid protein
MPRTVPMPGRLNSQLNRLIKLQQGHEAQREDIVRRAEADGREDLTARETTEFRLLTRQIDDISGRIEDMQGEVARSGRGGDREAAAVRRSTAGVTGSRGDGSPALEEREGWAWGHAPRLDFSVEQLRAAHEQMRAGGSVRMEQEQRLFSSADSLLPATLYPWVIGQIHEPRLLDRIPTQLVEAPSIEYIVHQSTTGSPGIVAEGALKPEVVMNYVQQTAVLQKIAGHVGVSYEIIDDFSNFLQYTQTELYREIIDAENVNLISGPGGAGQVDGFLSTSGTLTHVAGQASTGFTPLDDVEIAIAQLRAGPALADPDLFIVHPDSWSNMRRTKDTLGRYLLSADPALGEANSLWGVSVLQTTQITPGTGILLDSSKFGRAIVRGPIVVFIGFANDDFTRNIRRFVSEERVQLAVNRPSAVNVITGLPTTP